MDLMKVRIPLALVIGTLGAAAGSGGTVALAKAKQDATVERVESQSHQLEQHEHEIQALRERSLRIEVNTENTGKGVDRIEKRLEKWIERQR